MANYKAVANGNWSTLAIWEDDSGGSFAASTVLPGVSDDVYSNNYIVQVNQTISVKSLRQQKATSITVGGRFEVSTDINITTADGIFAGNVAGAAAAYDPTSSVLLIKAVCTTTITSDITGGLNYRYGLGCNADATITIIGNVSSGVGSYDSGIMNSSTGSKSITIIGNVTGGTGANALGFRHEPTGGVINITGNIYGYGVTGLWINASTTVNVTGNLYGGAGGSAYAIYNYSPASSTYTIIGNIIGDFAPALRNTNSGCIFNIEGNVYAGNTVAGILNNTSSPIYFKGSVQNSPIGKTAIECQYMFWDLEQDDVMCYYNSDAVTQNCLYAPGIAIGFPNQADVRKDEVYGPIDELTGTLAVPSPSNVASGVPTDDTVGTADFDLTGIQANLTIINNGVKKASNRIPHTTDLS